MNRAGEILPASALSETLGALETLDTESLRSEWRRLYRTMPPRCFSPDLLRREVAYRLQELALGGLSREIQRRLAVLARASADDPPKPAKASRRLKPGATLIREWHGHTYAVQVHETGFEHAGRRYTTLTQVARHITGAHWSGPRFFGLRRAARQTEARANENGAVDA